MTNWGERGRVESLDELCAESSVLMRELLSPPWDLSEIHQLSINTIFFSNPFTLSVLLLILHTRLNWHQKYENLHIIKKLK